MNSFDDNMRDRYLRRLEISARNQNRSIQIRVLKKAEREAARTDSVALAYFQNKERCDSLKLRLTRWKQKLLNSPLSMDLVKEDAARAARVSRQSHARSRSATEIRAINRRIEQVVLDQGYIDNPSELSELRNQKRQLLDQFYRLRAMRDIERSNSRRI